MKNLVKKVTGIEFLTGSRYHDDTSKVVRENLIHPYVSKTGQITKRRL